MKIVPLSIEFIWDNSSLVILNPISSIKRAEGLNKDSITLAKHVLPIPGGP